MPDTAVEITSLYEHWFGAIPGHDYDFIERTFREDWIYTDQFGAVRDRQEYVRIWRDLVADDHVDELQEIEVRDLGEVALAVGRYRAYGTFTNGVEVDLNLRFTGVWQRDENGPWRYAAHHTTDIGEQRW